MKISNWVRYIEANSIIWEYCCNGSVRVVIVPFLFFLNFSSNMKYLLENTYVFLVCLTRALVIWYRTPQKSFLTDDVVCENINSIPYIKRTLKIRLTAPRNVDRNEPSLVKLKPK